MLLKLRALKQLNKKVKFAVSQGTQKVLSAPLVSASLCVYVCFITLSRCLLSHQLHDLIENGTSCSRGSVTYSRLANQQETELLLPQAKEQFLNPREETDCPAVPSPHSVRSVEVGAGGTCCRNASAPGINLWTTGEKEMSRENR